MMTKTTKEFQTWLTRFGRKYKGVIKELAKGGRRAASDEKVKNKLSELNNRHKKNFFRIWRKHNSWSTKSPRG